MTVLASTLGDELPPAPSSVEGLVLRTESGFSTVLTDDGRRLQLRIAKKVKSGGRTSTTPVVIGDRVRVSVVAGHPDGSTVEAVLERRNELHRLAPGRRTMKDVLAANLDLLLIVQALHLPEYNTAQLDRFLAIAEQAEIPATIVLNKFDLAVPDEVEELATVYRQAGYPVILASAKTGLGLNAVEECLKGITALIGPSGVGKSTIVNAIRPHLRLRTGDVNEVTGKGKHTTVRSELLALGNGNYTADTPGLRSIALTDIDRYEVASLFKELRPLIGACKFPDCLHIGEPGCAVKMAMSEGRFSEARYDSYRRLLQHVADGYVEDWEVENR